MRFPVEVKQEQIPALIKHLVQSVGQSTWDRRFAWLQHELRENVMMRDWLNERCAIETALMDVLVNGELTGPRQYRLDLPGRYELAAFAAGFSAIEACLSQAAKKRLHGQLLDGLKTDKGLLPTQHEISTVVHLITLGFDVSFHDLEAGGGFDFLAERDGIAVEVECKVFSGDVGRKIHKRAFAKLWRRLSTRLYQVANVLRTGLLVRVTLPERLSSSDDQHEEIAKVVDAGLLSGHVQAAACVVSVSDFPVDHGPFERVGAGLIDQRELRSFVTSLTGNRNPSVALFVSLTGQVLLLLLESAKADDVVDGIRRQLRDGSKQLSGSRPGVLAAQLVDLNNEQLLELADSNFPTRALAPPLQVMTSDLLQADHRRHVHSVIYRGTPSTAADGPLVTSVGASYFMRNESHSLASDPRLAILGQPIDRRRRIVVP